MVWRAGRCLDPGSLPAPARMAPAVFTPATSLPSIHWLIRARWLVIAGLAGAALLAQGLGIIEHGDRLVLLAALLLAANTGYLFAARRLHLLRSAVWGQGFLFVQFSGDLVALAVAVHLGGGPDNPFAWLFVLPVALASMLLPQRAALVLVLVAVLAHGGTTLAEGLGYLPHHALELGHHAEWEMAGGGNLWRNLPYLGAYLGAFATVLAAEWLVIGHLADTLRRIEARRAEEARVASVRARLAEIGGVAAGVAHTIRNPLHGLVGSLDLLRENLLTEGGQGASLEVLDAMQEAVARIEHVTRRLVDLDVDRPASREWVSLRALAEEVRGLVAEPAERRRVSLEVKTEPSRRVRVPVLPLVEGMVSVVENAILASAPGQTVRLALSVTEAPSEWLRIEVVDQGEGIPAEHLKRIFEPFFTTRAPGEGSGLGLSIVRRVVEEQDGRVWVSSEPGCGTKVVMELPVDAR